MEKTRWGEREVSEETSSRTEEQDGKGDRILGKGRAMTTATSGGRKEGIPEVRAKIVLYNECFQCYNGK